ncbi:MAG TPA: GNAT family N-acetyltransferase [Candidatus Cybelea sp.]|nr:GNAT family N-acetyltransferase [Candidatus Cybelea sp.]
MPIDIRPAKFEDIPSARACLDVVAREQRYLAFFEAPPLEASRSWWSAMIEKGQPFRIAHDGERVIGWCDITPIPRPAFAHNGVLGIGLLPEMRGRGIGRRLLSATIDAARRFGLERIELDVFASNERARRLYLSLGFEVEGVRRRYAKLRGAYEDSTLMSLLLT